MGPRPRRGRRSSPSGFRPQASAWGQGPAGAAVSAPSIVAAPHCGDRLFRVTSALTRFPPLAVVRASPPPPDLSRKHKRGAKAPQVSERSGAPVGHLPKAKATRTNQSKQAESNAQAVPSAPIEIAEAAVLLLAFALIIVHLYDYNVHLFDKLFLDKVHLLGVQ